MFLKLVMPKDYLNITTAVVIKSTQTNISLYTIIDNLLKELSVSEWPFTLSFFVDFLSQIYSYFFVKFYNFKDNH
ncbi:hypothetical protein [Methanobrevibacter sp.]|uniref:hypothetical protein n=1 Tax=Methanobrevibacter sp. TaxID=66852 RepID=UPI0038906C07